jgi:hypothetical protein
VAAVVSVPLLIDGGTNSWFLLPPARTAEITSRILPLLIRVEIIRADTMTRLCTMLSSITKCHKLVIFPLMLRTGTFTTGRIGKRENDAN